VEQPEKRPRLSVISSSDLVPPDYSEYVFHTLRSPYI
jgi:hypothetical protein